jgi:hypothetical protein
MHRGLAALAVVAAFAVVPAAAVSAPPANLFKHGYDKCKAASVGSVAKAVGAKIAKARFSGKDCTWSTFDGSVTILFDTHPTGYMEYLVPKPGRAANGDVTRKIAVLGASKALLETHSFAAIHRHAKDLFAQYAAGVVQVSINSAPPLSDGRCVALMRLLTRT